MRYFQDIGLLLLFSFFSVFYHKMDYAFVLAFLLCLIFCCCSYFIESRKIHLILGLILVAATVPIPQLYMFFPVIFYIFFLDCLYIPVLAGGFLYFYQIFVSKENILFFSFWSILLFLLSFYLQYRTKNLEILEQQLMKIRDDNMEKNFLLTEKNRILVKNQNYEIYNATLKERNRIAREIHDNVGHLLSRSILVTGAAKTINTSDTLSPVLDNLDQSLNEAMTSIRSSVHDLHDESINLKEIVKKLITEFTFCKISLEYDMSYEIPSEIKYCFISIIKEALSNVSRHSNASHVQITIREHPALYQLCIKDNGTSISLKTSREITCRNKGIGLSNMKDRLAPLNGTLQITTENGFQLFITIPKKQED